jgi:hypothetical protein
MKDDSKQGYVKIVVIPKYVEKFADLLHLKWCYASPKWIFSSDNNIYLQGVD